VPVTIGNDVSMGPRAQILALLHPVGDHELRRADWEFAAPITIGDNVWLGGVVVCAGATIGENSVIGAGSVVTRDIPPRVFAAAILPHNPGSLAPQCAPRIRCERAELSAPCAGQCR
jgi:acetyltransferase-like isoleucine patch superfamily enzyme